MGRGVVQTPWTTDEIAKLMELRSQGLGSTAIAKALGRTESSVSAKVKSLGLPTRPYRGRFMATQPKHEPVPRYGVVSLPPLPSLSDDT